MMGRATARELGQPPAASTSKQVIEDYPHGLFSPASSQPTPSAGSTTTTNSNSQYAALHFQPATRRTVVTTTTTTTISFAPLHVPIPAEAPIMSEAECDQTYPSQCLPASSSAPPERVNGKLDPRKYPLARAVKPDSLLGSAKLQLGGAQAALHESSSSGAPSNNNNGDASDTSLASASNNGSTSSAQIDRQLLQQPSLHASTSRKMSARSSDEGDDHEDEEEESAVDRHLTSSARKAVAATAKPARKRVKVHHTFSPEPENLQMPSPIPSPELRPISHPPRSPHRKTSRPARPSHRYPYQPASPPITTVDKDFAASHCHHMLTDSAEEDATNSAVVPINLGSGVEVATLMSLPSLVERFGELPNNLQSHVLFNLLRRSSVPVLQAVNEIIAPALKRDFLRDLPWEVATLICTYIPGRDLCRASRVSKKWSQVIDGDGTLWHRKIVMEGLWVGDGSEQSEYEEIARGQLPQTARQRFLKKWLSGTWDMHYNPAHAEKSAARKIQAVTSPPGKPLNNPFSADSPLRSPSKPQQGARSPGSNKSSPVKKGTTKLAPRPPTSPQTRLPQRPGRFVHPFKIMYKRRSLSRHKWYNGEALRHAIPGHGNAVTTCLQFDRDRIASASDNLAINVYDLRQNGAHTQLMGHTGGVWALEYLGDTLVSGSTDRTVRVWDLKTGRCTHVLLGHISTVRCLQIVEPQNVNPDPEGEPVWEPPYPLIVTGSRDTTLRVWKLPKPGQRDYLPPVPPSPDQDNIDPDVNPFHVKMMAGHHHAIRALSAHGRIAVSGSYDKTGRVWDILSGTCLHVLRGHGQRVYSVEYDPKEHRAATGSMDGSVRLWSTKTGECLHSLWGHDALVGLLGLTPHSLVSGAADSTLRIWDSSTGQCRSVLAAHSGAITCFQNDNQKVLSGGDGSLKLWDMRTGKFVRDLVVNCQGIWQVGFQDGFVVAAVLRNGQSEFESEPRVCHTRLLGCRRA